MKSNRLAGPHLFQALGAWEELEEVRPAVEPPLLVAKIVSV